MASSTTTSRLLTVLLGFLALSISATARPCRTFFISSYSVSFRRHSSAATLTTFKEIRSLEVVGNNDENYDNPFSSAEIFFDGALSGLTFEEDERETEFELRASQIRAPFGFSSHNSSSFRDRAKDIVSVVLALLFGVAGGAFTAIGLYLIWSVLSDRYDYRDSDDEYVDEDEEIDSPYKTGYVKTPAFESAPAPAKESVSHEDPGTRLKPLPYCSHAPNLYFFQANTAENEVGERIDKYNKIVQELSKAQRR